MTRARPEFSPVPPSPPSLPPTLSLLLQFRRPPRPADHQVDCRTWPEPAAVQGCLVTAIRYNVEPDFAVTRGFERPIMHGLCTYGIACRAVVAAACSYLPDGCSIFYCQFAAPALPGDTIRTENLDRCGNRDLPMSRHRKGGRSRRQRTRKKSPRQVPEEMSMTKLLTLHDPVKTRAFYEGGFWRDHSFYTLLRDHAKRRGDAFFLP